MKVKKWLYDFDVSEHPIPVEIFEDEEGKTKTFKSFVHKKDDYSQQFEIKQIVIYEGKYHILDFFILVDGVRYIEDTEEECLNKMHHYLKNPENRPFITYFGADFYERYIQVTQNKLRLTTANKRLIKLDKLLNGTN